MIVRLFRQIRGHSRWFVLFCSFWRLFTTKVFKSVIVFPFSFWKMIFFLLHNNQTPRHKHARWPTSYNYEIRQRPWITVGQFHQRCKETSDWCDYHRYVWVMIEWNNSNLLVKLSKICYAKILIQALPHESQIWFWMIWQFLSRVTFALSYLLTHIGL